MDEAKDNNKSLMNLKECVRAKEKMASEQGFVHIPWRMNKLTMLLKASLRSPWSLLPNANGSYSLSLMLNRGNRRRQSSSLMSPHISKTPPTASTPWATPRHSRPLPRNSAGPRRIAPQTRGRGTMRTPPRGSASSSANASGDASSRRGGCWRRRPTRRGRSSSRLTRRILEKRGWTLGSCVRSQ